MPDVVPSEFGPYQEPEDIRDLRDIQQVATKCFWIFMAGWIVTLAVYVGIYLSRDSFAREQINYWWLCIPGSLVAIDGLAWAFCAKAIARKAPAAWLAYEQRLAEFEATKALASDTALAQARDVPYEVDKYWFVVEDRDGRDVLVMYVRYGVLNRIATGSALFTQTFLVEDVGWTQNLKSGRRFIYFRDQETDGSRGHYPEIVSPERPFDPDLLAAGIPDFVPRS